MRSRQIVTIARFTLLEALRTRLFWLFIALMLVILGLGYFMQQLAITESARLQTAFSAAALRFAAVFVLSVHVLASVIREFNDKGLELTLSFELRRSQYIVGRLLGFVSIAMILATAATLPFLLLSHPSAALQWGTSLAFELALVAALSLFGIITFTSLMAAASFVFGFYLLSRALTAIRLMSDTPLTGGGTPAHHVISGLVDILALILPALDRYTQSTWLTDSPLPWPSLATLAAQAVLYTVLLGAAAMFDFYRRNL